MPYMHSCKQKKQCTSGHNSNSEGNMKVRELIAQEDMMYSDTEIVVTPIIPPDSHDVIEVGHD